MGYLRPTDGRTLCSRDCHRGRNPPSQEAGTDIWSDFGTPLRAPASGTVFEVGGSIYAATGYFVTIDLDDGRRIRFLHLWDRYVSRGQRVFRGTVFAQSGGSGYGSMYAAGGAGTVGRHVHVTLWPTHAYSFGTNANTLDFERYADPNGSTASLEGATPIDIALPTPSEEDDMPINFRNGATGITYTMVPGHSIRAHDNGFGDRLMNYINTGRWPATEDLKDRFNAGVRDLNRDHVLWMLPFYGFGRLTPETLPQPGTTVYADKIVEQDEKVKAITDSITPGQSGVKFDGQLWSHIAASGHQS